MGYVLCHISKKGFMFFMVDAIHSIGSTYYFSVHIH